MSCVQELKGEYLSPYPAKWFRKFEPSPIIDEVLYHVGVLKDDAVKRVTPKKAKADKHGVKVNKREVYALVAKSLLRPQIEEDPLTTLGALIGIRALVQGALFAPNNSSINWANCGDSQYETCSFTSDLSTITYGYSLYVTNTHGPYFFINSTAISGSPLPTTTAPIAYAQPCPISNPNTITNATYLINGKVMLRAWACQNSSSSLYYTRFSATDSSTNSYTIAAAGMGVAVGSVANWHYVYNLPSSSSKASTDIYYYIYEIDVQYS